MIALTLYEPSGRIIGHITRSNDVVLSDDVLWLPGHVPQDHYIKNGQAYPLPPDPSDEDRIYEYDYDQHCWKIDQAITRTRIRHNRDLRLQAIDQVNPVRFASLTADQQQELQRYRQALLDVPQQPGFPTEIEWPAKPAWL